jgi:hypothetical protein
LPDGSIVVLHVLPHLLKVFLAGMEDDAPPVVIHRVDDRLVASGRPTPVGLLRHQYSLSSGGTPAAAWSAAFEQAEREDDGEEFLRKMEVFEVLLPALGANEFSPQFVGCLDPFLAAVATRLGVA